MAEKPADGSAPKILRVTLMQDPDCRNPTDGDSEWSIYTWRHYGHHLITDVDRERFYDDDDNVLPDIQSKLDRGFAFWIRFRDYGSEQVYRLCDDDDHIAGLMVWEHDESDLNTDIEVRRTGAEDFLEEYSRWANGDCYGYKVEKLQSATPEYDPDVSLDNGAYWAEEDSCWGFIGETYFKEEIGRVLKNYEGYRVVYKGDASYLMS